MKALKVEGMSFTENFIEHLKIIHETEVHSMLMENILMKFIQSITPTE